MSKKDQKSTPKKSKDYLQLSIKPEALKNINFSVADEVYEKDPESREKYKQQRFEQGFDDTETWHIDRTLALFIIPRLKRFIEVNNGIPNGETVESYNEKLNFIINAFENYYATDRYYQSTDSAERKQLTDDVRKAVGLLSNLWFELWW
jgi:uncharacterized protein YqcC (DUF446 family)